MKHIKILFVLLTVLAWGTVTYSQSSFSLDAYRTYLQSNQNMAPQQLLSSYSAGVFKSKINKNLNDVLYFDSIASKYNLTEDEKALISKNGFMFSERLSRGSFGETFLEIFHNDLPVFISTDAILHAFHSSYDKILIDVENEYLIPAVQSLLTGLHSRMNVLHTQYGGDNRMKKMLHDVDIYLTTAKKLLDNNSVPFYPDNSAKINYLLDKITEADGVGLDTLFADACVMADWSQFKPRGHYNNDQFPMLAKYFKAMMWLGRVELYLIPPRAFDDNECKKQDIFDAQRQIMTTVLLAELFDNAGLWEKYADIESVLTFFVGKQDNVTLSDIDFLRTSMSPLKADSFLDTNKVLEFQNVLKDQSFANQKILSQILISDPFSTDSIIPASAFMLFGQRFVIDSYVTGNVVFDRIVYNNNKICRLFPKTLDAMFALGNNAAAQLLIPELETYKYSSNSAALRYLIDSFDPEFWDASIYNMWLNSIRQLNTPDDRGSLPEFMQTAAFWQQKLNTQLSSWTQLRHDNLLYAKQSYTGGTVCSFPYTYIEPFPEFYKAIKHFAESSRSRFENLPFDNSYNKTKMLEYTDNVKSIMGTLITVSEKILSGEAFSETEKDFLQMVMYDTTGGSGQVPYKGWYPMLFYKHDEYKENGLMEKDHITADIHTTPTDCGGNYIGAVTHVGTGNINLGVIVADLPGGITSAFIGPALSYYEYVTSNFQRLTDEEWADTYLMSALRPDWVNIYLADKNGSSRGEGSTLITAVDYENPPLTADDHVVLNNFPNPFNPSTIISFNVPASLTGSRAVLRIFNMQGELVTVLLDEVLPSGKYLVKWNGNNSAGTRVSSGVYLYNLTIKDKQISGKMTLLK